MVTDDLVESEERPLVEGKDVLRTYQNNKWGVVDDLFRNSSVQSVRNVQSIKRVKKTVRYEDEELTKEIPTSAPGSVNLSTHFKDGIANDREAFVPENPENTSFDFPLPDTERVSDCPDCAGQGQTECTKCSGWGKKKCWCCNGTGRGKGKHWDKCRACSGRGTKFCKSCDVDGMVDCKTCDKKGKLWNIDFIRRNYSVEEHITVDSPEIPGKFIRNAEGEYLNTEKNKLQTNELQNETEVYRIETTIVEYIYSDTNYKLYGVGSNGVKSIDYPQSLPRKAVPYALVGIATILIVASIYLYTNVL